MAEMVRYNDYYVDMAYVLVKQKSNNDEIKAAEDLYAIDTILGGMDTCINAHELDERLRNEYKTIGMMEAVANKFVFNDGRPMNRIITDNEKIMNSLKLDKMGIVADVLIKHNIIKCVDTLYVKFKGNTTF
ncbi:hypothetical protein [Lachnospira eligens]|uniref:hypothetical protein n=1 Tax=Lachnospira eligens TaxID=39485 RepID=UPI000E522D83|nr:hypothetical protein [Lachnospira eligens]RGT55380.1 hypothetical protein DWX21_04065 [Lachnospira eligens]